MALKKFVINPFKTDTTKTLTSFEAPKIAQSSQPYQPPKKAPSLLTPEAQARGALLPVSRGGLAPAPATTTTRTTTKPAFDNEAALAGLQRQAAANNALYESQQQQIQEAPIISEAEGGGEVGVYAPRGGSGTTGAGAGGYTPPGLSPIEEEGVDTEQPTPGSVQAQPFTNPQGSGAIAGGAGGTQPQTLASKYESGFNAANAALGATGGGTGGITSAQGASLVNQYSPTRRNDTASAIVQTDPFLAQLIKSVQDFINPETQAQTLVESYRSMQKELGLEDINEKLISLENVMRGTEEDIKTEIMRGGGTATSSQVRGLVNARNKTFIEEYSMLQRTLESKEKYLNTLVGLEIQDRQSADQRFNQGFSMLFNIAEYQQRAQHYTRDSSQWVISQIGANGLYNSTGGDPYMVSLLEQELGFNRGGLIQAAQQAQQARFQAQQQAQLDLQLKRQQIITPEERALDLKYKQAQLKKLDADTRKVYNDLADQASRNKKLTGEQYKALGF